MTHKETEFRIGNIIFFDDYDVDFVIDEIYKENGQYVVEAIGGKNGTWSNPVSLIEPRLLSMVYMEKFGFTYNDLNGDSGHWQKKNPSAAGLIEILESDENGFSFDYMIEIKYVHQLQNLYFALTGEELTVNKEIK